MPNVLVAAPGPAAADWRELVWPREHGSWSLALEPVALGLIAAPSLGGGALAIATIAAFFARRPLRTAFTEVRAPRRAAAMRAALICASAAAAFLAIALRVSGAQWLGWLLPAVVGGAFFLWFDLRRNGREQHAEIAGAFAFASLPAAFAAIAGWSALEAAALAVVMVARAVPTVITVRAAVRARKSGVLRPVFPTVVSLSTAVAILFAARVGLVTWFAAALLGFFALRTVALMVYPAPRLKPSVIGLFEALAGCAFVLIVGATW